MNKHYVITDLHGQYKLWNQIKEYIDDTDTLYCLGDCIDRGPHGIEIMLEMLNRPNTVYIRGNHEEFFQFYGVDGYCGEVNGLWAANGGNATCLNMQDVFKTVEDVVEIRNKISKLPSHYRVTINGRNIIFTHSGYCNEQGGYFRDRDPYLWDRDHFLNKWELNDNEYIIHGHTPCNILLLRLNEWKSFVAKTAEEKTVEEQKLYDLIKNWNENPEIVKYCDGHKIDLDLCSIVTGKAALFNLETFEVEKYFSIKEEQKNEN